VMPARVRVTQKARAGVRVKKDALRTCAAQAKQAEWLRRLAEQGRGQLRNARGHVRLKSGTGAAAGQSSWGC